MEWVNFRHLYSFWMVQREGGFKAASERMLVSQSTVSDQVAQLEDYLQSKLFERTTRILKLTEAGHQLFQYAEDIFQKSREINRVLRDRLQGVQKTQLKLGIVGGVSRNLLYRFLANILHHNPQMEIDITNGAYDELIQSCQQFELDFLISAQPPYGKELMNFNSRLIQNSPLCLTGHKKIINKIKKNQVKDLQIPLYYYSYPYREGSVIDKLERLTKRQYNLKIETDDISLLRFFAASGEGVALVPEIGVQEDILQGKLDRIILEKVEKIQFFAVFSKQAVHLDQIEEILSY